MEEILRKLQKDASGHKHKAIRDACVHACGECAPASGLSGGAQGGYGSEPGLAFVAINPNLSCKLGSNLSLGGRSLQ